MDDFDRRLRAEIHRQGAKDSKGTERTEPSVHADRCAYAVIGAAIEVHRTLGPGFLEKTYEDALVVELGLRRINYRRQVPINVQYKSAELEGYRLDLLVEDVLVVELKAVTELLPIHTAQVLAYLKASNLELALLLNFNREALRDRGIRRVVRGSGT
ncbi:MAG TPA: GxxExxY protein [Kofleriaceae bacterium]